MKDLPKKVYEYLITDNANPEEILHISREIPFVENFRVSEPILIPLIENIQPYYLEKNIYATRGFFYFLKEPLKNANWHGGQRDGKHVTHFDLFLAPTRFIAGINDEGEYFGREEIKQAWENRELFPEKHHVANENVGYGIGTGNIYRTSELIYVDTNNKTLYVGTSINAPQNSSLRVLEKIDPNQKTNIEEEIEEWAQGYRKSLNSS